MVAFRRVLTTLRNAAVLGLVLVSWGCTTSDDTGVVADIAGTPIISSKRTTFDNPMLSEKESYWRGHVFNRNAEGWPIGIRLSGKISNVFYPTLRCGGEWYKIIESSSDSIYWENLSSGKDKCFNNGFIQLSLQKSGNIIFKFRKSASGSVEIGGLLERGRLDDTNPESLIRLTKNQILYRKEQPVQFEVPRDVENEEYIKIVTAANETKQKEIIASTEQKKKNGGGKSVDILQWYFNSVVDAASEDLSGRAPSPGSGANASYPAQEYVVKCRKPETFGNHPKVQLPAGSCSDSESACILKIKNKLEAEIIDSIVYYCAKKLGSANYKTDGVYRK